MNRRILKIKEVIREILSNLSDNEIINNLELSEKAQLLLMRLNHIS